MKLLVVALVVAVAAAVDVVVFSQPDCSSEGVAYSIDTAESSWLNLCQDSVVSVRIPPMIEVAVYNQCRDDLHILDASPGFTSHLAAVDGYECVNFVTNDGNAPDRLSLQFIQSYEDICLEHAEHAYQFCPYGDCTVECDDAIEAGFSVQDSCSDVDMTRFVWEHPFAMEKKAAVPSSNKLIAVKQAADGRRREHHEHVMGGGPGPVQGEPTQGEPTQGEPTQGVPTQGVPTQGEPTQGVPTQGVPTQGEPTQGVPTQGEPTQGTGGNEPSYDPKLCFTKFMERLATQFEDECQEEAEHMVSWFFLLSSTVLLTTASLLLCCVWKRRSSRTIIVRTTSAVPVVISTPAVPTTETVVLAEMPCNLPVGKVYPEEKAVDTDSEATANEQIDRDYAYALKLAESQ